MNADYFKSMVDLFANPLFQQGFAEFFARAQREGIDAARKFWDAGRPKDPFAEFAAACYERMWDMYAMVGLVPRRTTAGSQDGGAAWADVLLKSQKQVLESWTDATGRFYKALGNGPAAPVAATGASDAFGLCQSWLEGLGRYVDLLMKAHPLGPGAEVLPKLLGTSDVAMRLYQFWEPLVRAIREKALDPAACKDFLDPAKIAQLTDRVFGFGPTASGADVFGQTLRLAETWGGRAREFLGPWAEALQKLADVSPALATGDPEAQRKAFDHLQAAFQETFGKLLKMPAVGKDREATELLLRTVDRWSVFVAKNAEFQAEIQKIAQQAMKEVVEVLAQKVRDGQELGGIEELSKLWAETNEKAFLDLFRTEQFARLQGLLLDAALDARRHVQRLLEHCLKDFPVALRSEMDDVYQTAHALKRSVRALGRKSAEVEALRDELRRLEQRIAALEKGSSATDEEAAR